LGAKLAKNWVVNAAKEEICPAVDVEEEKCRSAIEVLANQAEDGADDVEKIFEGEEEELEKFREELKEWMEEE